MFQLAALLVLAGSFWSSCRLVRLARRAPLPRVAAHALPLLVCAEALLIHLLSALHAVARPGLIGGNLLFIAAGATWGIGNDRSRLLRRLRRFTREPGSDSVSIWVMTLGALALLAALAYRPTNWDSMAYHLSRIVYWIEHRSVFGYITAEDYQVMMTPGAEYLLLVAQVVSNSDRYVSLLQFAAWILLACAAPALARAFGSSRRLSRWASLLVAAAPMAILQASSTQNDLVSAEMTVAIIFATLPFQHRTRHFRWLDLTLLAVSCCAGWMVKPTSVVVAAPFLLLAALHTLPFLFRDARARRHLLLASPVLLLLLGVILPFLRIALPLMRVSTSIKPYVYSSWKDPGDRVANELRGVLRNIPLPLPVFDRLAPA